MTVQEFIKSRNEAIYLMFIMYKLRQKQIANIFNLSESQVKHIIGSVKKQLKETI